MIQFDNLVVIEYIYYHNFIILQQINMYNT